MKKAIILTSVFLSISTFANRSVDIWKNYFPNMNCNRNHCAKNVPAEALEEMLEKASYHAEEKLTSTNWAFVADFTQNSREKRGYLINMNNGDVTTYHVAHGINSGDGNGNAIRFSNRNESRQSSLGLYLTAETYHGKHGYSLRMDGLESSNSLARPRAIVIHGADYVPNANGRVRNRIGRSWGCPAVAKNLSRALIDKLKGGSIYYIHGE